MSKFIAIDLDPQGLFVAAGPNVRSAGVQGRLEDVTPTVLALLGVPVPDDLDGRVLDFVKDLRPEMVEAGRGGGGARATASGAAAPGDGEAQAGAGADGRDPATGYTEEEEEAVRRRLEDLGYL